MTTQEVTCKNILDYLVKFYPDKLVGLNYIKEYYNIRLDTLGFLQEYYDYINQRYLQIKIISYEDFFYNFPFLGNFTKTHSFRKPSLYRHLNPTEPQFTKALSRFLLENPKSCKAFLKAIFSLLNKEANFPENGYNCLCEVVTCDVCSKNKRLKRIDNVILWEKEALCLEIKFEAVIDNNDLKVYEQQMNKMAKDKNKTYVVISIDDLRDTIRQKKCDNWQNLRWCDVLRLWEENVYHYNIDENEDMTRYRSSLWNKILYWED